MGNSIGFFWKLLGYQQQLKLVMLGYGNAGKTTILYRLRLGEVVNAVSTVGFNVETVVYGNMSFTVMDCGYGSGKLHPLWVTYLNNGPEDRALIYVVDSADRSAIDESRYTLHYILGSVGRFSWERIDNLKCVLVLANKQDMCGAMSVEEVQQQMQIEPFKLKIPWTVMGCSATTGQGLYEALDWLIDNNKNPNEKQR